MLVIGPQETLLISPHCYLFAGNAIHSFLMVPLGRRRRPNRESGIQSGSFFLFSRVAFFIPLGSYYSTMAELFTVDRQFDCRNKLVDKTARLSPEQGKRKKKKGNFRCQSRSLALFGSQRAKARGYIPMHSLER